MGVDLNLFIGDPSCLANKNNLAKCLPSCVLSAAEVCCIYVCNACCMMDIIVSCQWLLLCWQIQNKLSLFVRMCLLLNC